MVNVEVTLFGALAKIAGERTVELEASTLGDAVNGLISRCGEEVRKRLFDEKGRVRRFVNIYVNGRDMRFLQNLETPLKDGDKISIIPAVGGG